MLYFNRSDKPVEVNSVEIRPGERREVALTAEQHADLAMGGPLVLIAYGTFAEDEGTSTAPPDPESFADGD